MRTTNIIDNAVTSINEIRGPKGELAGWSFQFMDRDDGTIYEVPIAKELAEKYASRIIAGSGKVVRADKLAMNEEIAKVGGKV